MMGGNSRGRGLVGSNTRPATAYSSVPSLVRCRSQARIKDDSKDKKKKRKRTERRFNVEKATNAHMRELFEGAQPTNIDSK